MLSHIRRNRTETERRTENVHGLDFSFFDFGGRISANTTGYFNYTCTNTTKCVVYNFVITEAIDGIVQRDNSAIILQIQDYILQTTDKTQSDYKDHEIKAVTWNNIRKSVDLPGLGQIILQFFRFRPRIWFICERSAENATMQFGCGYGFGLVSVYM